MAYDYKDKTANILMLNHYMLAKTLSMFEYQGLPETIPAHELEKIIQSNGLGFITEVNGSLYAFNGSLGGETGVYGLPTTININNTYLKLSKNYNLVEDGVLFKNDDMQLGLIKLFEKSNSLLIENDINMIMWGFNSRTQHILSASDDKAKASAENYIKKIVDGELSVIGENTLFESSFKMQSPSSGKGDSIKPMIELQQYIKGSLYNEIGLSAAFNMKKERLISSELDQSEDSLFPLVYNMMKCRIEAVKLLNAKYDLNVSVDFGSVWHFKNRKLVDGIVDKGDLPNEASEQRNEESNNNVSGENVDNVDIEKIESDEVNNDLVIDENEAETLALAQNNELEELQEIINNPESSPEDIQAAKDLVLELEGD